MSLLEVDNLKMYIRLRTRVVKAVDGVSFVVEAGETFGIVGESGCGKTMTASSIMRLLPPRGSHCRRQHRLDGGDLTHVRSDTLRSVRGNKIGMVFQDPMTSLNPTMTIGRQIAGAYVLHKRGRRRRPWTGRPKCSAWSGCPDPRERLDDYPHQLSGGLRQRVMIAMALACSPRLLIADEPTTALDVTIQAQILDAARRPKSALGMAMILITHDMGVIAGQADRGGGDVRRADRGDGFHRRVIRRRAPSLHRGPPGFHPTA